MNKKRTVILGFINSWDVKDKRHFNSWYNVKCVIYGKKDEKLWGKNIIRPIDWELNKRINDIYNRVNNIDNSVKDIKKDIDEVKGKVDIVYNYIKAKMEKGENKKHKGRKEKNIKKEKIFLGKKIERNTSKEKEDDDDDE